MGQVSCLALSLLVATVVKWFKINSNKERALLGILNNYANSKTWASVWLDSDVVKSWDWSDGDWGRAWKTLSMPVDHESGAIVCIAWEPYEKRHSSNADCRSLTVPPEVIGVLSLAPWSSKMVRTCPWSVWDDTWTGETLHLNINVPTFTETGVLRSDLDCYITFWWSLALRLWTSIQ